MQALAVAPSSSALISTGINNIIASLEAAATEQVDRYLVENIIDPRERPTDTEREALIVVRALQLVNGIEFGAVLARGQLLLKIRRENILTAHPGNYTSLQDMARDNGISISELSFTLDLVETIFPWLEGHGFNLATLWEEIGSSKFKELCPVLKSLITGTPSTTATVRNSVDLLLDDIAATDRAANNGERTMTDQQMREEAVGQLVEAGRTLPVAQLRRHVRRDRTQNIVATVVAGPGAKSVLISDITEEQMEMVNRLLGTHVDWETWDVPEDVRMRQAEAYRVAALRNFLSRIGVG